MKAASALLCVLICLFAVNFTVAQTSRRTVPRTVASRPLPSDSSSPTNTLPIRRVILYSNGVAYIERRGTVRNHAEVSLSFKQSQVDDVLKSMVVLDLGRGRIGAVSYNSSAPPSSRMSEIPFSISASTDGNNGGGLPGVLSQLQGARVVVTVANRTFTGSILTVEAKHSQIDANKPAVTNHRLVIASDNGEVSGFDLAEIRSVQLVDAGSRKDLTEFAHAAASARRRDAKTIVVTSEGVGDREMVISYTIAAPIWKTTYRVVLDRSGKPYFQGWAIVDNISEEDWNAIQLSLVSGTPVSFIQQIQNPVYRYRPVLPLPQDLNLKPQTYEPGESNSGSGSLSGVVKDSQGSVIPGAEVVITNNTTNQSFEVTTNSSGIYSVQDLPPGTYTVNFEASGFKKLNVTQLVVRPGLRATYGANLDVASIAETVTVVADQDNSLGNSIDRRQITNLPLNSRSAAGLLALKPGVTRSGESLGNLVTGGQSGVDAATSASEIGDLFEYRIDQPVTVPRDRSALIPILQTRMEGERVSIYSPDGPANRPMSGMLLKNTSSLTLDDGAMTVIDGDAYAGEALMARLKPGEERLISFALDLGTLVNIHDADDKRNPTFMVKAVNGVFQAHYHNTRSKTYTLVNQTDRERVVFLEHPIDEEDNWQLVDDLPRSMTRTAKHYRFRVVLKPHEKVDFPVLERQELYDSYQLSQLSSAQLQFFVSEKYIDEQTRAALAKLVDLRSRIAEIDGTLGARNKETAEISADQQRLRDNIKVLATTAEAKQLITRYVAKANEQETRLEQIERERRGLVDQRGQIQSELDALIRSFSIDRKLK
jgi:hypothetical protein